MEHPPLVSLSLGDKAPEIVKGEPKYRGHALYGLLRYGSPNSPQVILVIDDAGGGDFELYDMRNEPQEERNLARDPRHRERVEDSKRQLTAWRNDKPAPVKISGMETPA